MTNRRNRRGTGAPTPIWSEPFLGSTLDTNKWSYEQTYFNYGKKGGQHLANVLFPRRRFLMLAAHDSSPPRRPGRSRMRGPFAVVSNRARKNPKSSKASIVRE